MSLVAITAGRGSRGVTTAALALGAAWPEPPLVAECDPDGGSLAASFGLPPTPGLLSLASTARREVDPAVVAAHTQTVLGGLEVLLAPPTAEQAEGLGRFWPTLAPMLGGLDRDVLADCGRLRPRSGVLELLRRADLVVVLAQPTPDGLEQLRGRLVALEAAGLRASVVLRGERPYTRAEVASWLAGEGVAATVAGVLADDQRRVAELLAGEPGWRHRLDRSLLLRSARTLAEELHHGLASEGGSPATALHVPGPAEVELAEEPGR
jgi:MinD-like ATPase involved in chromosome partitioning or flagellar assembly